MERLQKLLAQAGFGSRRGCEQLILDGKVTVNGEVVKELGAKADPMRDEVEIEGQPLHREKPVYLMLNKPKGVITSMNDPEGRKVVSDFLHDVEARVFPIGRLDYDTEGLLLLTNDGSFANLMTHPRYKVPKTYHVTVEGIVKNTVLDKLANGVRLKDGMTKPAEVEYVDVDPERKRTVFSITIREGRNRQIRRMCEKVHLTIILLKRVQYGPLPLGTLPRGRFRELSFDELNEMHLMASGEPMKKPSARSTKLPDAKRTDASGKNSRTPAKEGSSASKVKRHVKEKANESVHDPKRGGPKKDGRQSVNRFANGGNGKRPSIGESAGRRGRGRTSESTYTGVKTSKNSGRKRTERV